MFKKYKIGNSDNNGILILLSTVDRKIRIEVGYGLGGILSDYRVGEIIDSHIYLFIIIVLIVKAYQIIDFIKNPGDRSLISFILFDFLHLGFYNWYFRKRNSKGSGFGCGGGSSRNF